MTKRKRSGPPAAIATRIVRMPLAELELLELNARFMRHETYTQLVENVRRDGGLTSVPFACLTESGRYRVLSGNHRVQAAIDAGVVDADVMVTDDPLDEQRQVALQLAHNAIAGEDDPAVLKQLYEQLDEIDWRVYSGLDDKTLALFEKVDVGGLNEARLDWQSIGFLFLPEEAEAAAAVLAEAKKLVTTDKTWLARWGEYDRLLDALAETSDAHGITNQATALTVVLEIFSRHRADLAGGWLDEAGDPRRPKEPVPIASVLGSDRLPAATAALLKKRLEAIAGRKEIPANELWRAVDELLA